MLIFELQQKRHWPMWVGRSQRCFINTPFLLLGILKVNPIQHDRRRHRRQNSIRKRRI